MSSLKVTLIDVGWGDSILIESEDANGVVHYALIDSNDSENLRSSQIFLKRHFEKAGIVLPDAKPVFDFVLLSHWHADHADGLKALMKAFGTAKLWYPKSEKLPILGALIRYANRSSNVKQHQAIDTDNALPKLGNVEMSVLWPPSDCIDTVNENNNSVVLSLRLDQVSFILTGDAEKEVWANVSSLIPSKTKFFKVPHHGSKNGTLDSNGSPVWLSNCPPDAYLGISSHISPHGLPDTEVIDLLDNSGRKYYRTDLHYHLIFKTDGQNVTVKYSH